METTLKTKVINITDLLADPDDEQSLVRMFVTSNQIDLKGIIVGTSCWRKNQDQSGMSRLNAIINAYGEALPNLQIHADGYPSLEYVKSVAVMGQTGYSMNDVGDGKDSDGSELIISVVDEDDRPVWINLWGGANTLAQALWKVKSTRSEAAVEEFVSKIRVYDVLGQDEAGAWIVTTFPDLLYIRSTLVYGFGGTPGMKGDDYRNKIRSCGALGAVYPLQTYGAFEGDSPSFMYQIPTGMNDPEHIDWGSWGGRFSLEKKTNIRSMSAVTNEADYGNYYMYGDCSEKEESVNRWAAAYQNDFLARMIWSVTDSYDKANHHPIAVLNGDNTLDILEMTADAGETVTLSADGSFDPDGDSLSYKWYIYRAAGTYSQIVKMRGNGITADLEIPEDSKDGSIHVILEIHDNGTPELYVYRRMIINVKSRRQNVNVNNQQKFRVVISTDFPPIDTRYPFKNNTPNNRKSDPDDLQSMVRFLLYANEFDVEGLIASAATFEGIANKQNIIDMINIYAKAYDKLKEYSSDYPTAEELISVTYQGNNQTWGKSVENNIGESKDSEASDAIIQIVDKEDDRPVWFCIWGDCSSIAQAVYRVKESRSPEEIDKFISKMRIYQVAHQDDTIDWLMDNFPDLFVIFAEKTYMGIFRADDLNWTNENIINNHGSLGAAYPESGMGCEGVCEGDTPSFLYLLSARFGYSDSENPTCSSWGGQFKQISGTRHYIDDVGPLSIAKHAKEFQDDFAKRLRIIQE